MKKMKRLFRVFLACVLLLSISAWYGISAVKATATETESIVGEAEKTQLTVSMSVEKGHAGDTVLATVSVSNNPGFAGLVFRLEYDSSVLQLVEAVPQQDVMSAGLATVYTGQTGMVGYSFAEAGNYRWNGKLLTVEFKICNGALTGETAVELAHIDMSNMNEETVEVTKTAGKLKIESESLKQGLVVEADGTVHYYENGVVSTKFNGMAADKNTGKKYWFEEGKVQGTEGRGKEIYDPETDAWYWLDSIQQGAVAVSKDVYQESWAGEFADREDGTGKWVRYDENGHMVKGWNEQNGNQYYFDMQTGAMAKGVATIDGKEYAFDKATGILIENGFYTENGKRYWYENGVRQGLEGRGKEIYDSSSDAWYWLDSIQQGAVAVSKDVYQESWAGEFADREDGTGKWVRYDENGHMIKGWNEKDGSRYYFDMQTGAMAKGDAMIDGIWYHFDKSTGIMK